MMQTLVAEPLTKDAFAPFGDVIEVNDTGKSHAINAGTTMRFHDLATPLATGPNARVIISMARAQPFSPPLKLTMVERHPFGSQAFIPVRPTSFLVVVAHDNNGTPSAPRAFLATKGQGVNYAANVWHGVLTALDGETDFIIVDRDGDGTNLQEHHFQEGYEIKL
jgi:ureidoglycolate lyase